MAVNIGPKIGIDGEAEYRRELKSIIQETKTLAAETDQAAAAFKNDATNEKKAADVTEKLNKQIEAQRKLVEKLEDAVKKSTEQTGENSTETLKWKEQLAKAKTGLANLEGQTKDTTTEVKDLGAAEDATGEKTSVFGDVLKANLAGDAIKKGLEITKKIVQELGEFFIEAVKSAAEYADEINTLNSTTGLGTDTLQEYKYMAELVDVDLETITGSLTKLKRNMDSARDGNKTAAQAFADLGIEITDANGELRDSEEVFNEVLGALREIENPTERDAAAMEIFGKSAAELNPLIETSAEDLDAMKKEAHDVGAVLDKDTLNGLNKVNDGMDRLGLTWDAIKNTLGAKIGIAVLPELEKVVKIFQKFTQTGDVSALIDGISRSLKRLKDKIIKNMPKYAQEFGKAIGSLLGNLPELTKAGIEMGWAILKGLVQSIPQIGKSFEKSFAQSLLTEGTQEAIEKIEELSRKLKEIPGRYERISGSIGDLNAKQLEAEYWIQIFDKLSKKTNPTAEDTERLQTAVNKLEELYPELGLKIDEETGKWNLNTQEIRENIKALSARYEAEAYYAAAGDSLKQIAQIEGETRQLRQQNKALGNAIQNRQEVTAVMQTQQRELLHLRSEYNANKISQDQLTQSLAKYGLTSADQIMPKVGDLTVAIEKNKKEIANMQAEYDAGKKTLDEADGKIKQLTGDVEYFYDKASAKEEEYYKSVNHQKYLNDLTKALSDGTGAVRSKAEAVGIALGQGVEAGIEKESHNVYAKAEKMIRGSIQAMKNVAVIASPSKVTENVIGKNLALGIIKGWDDVMNPAKLSTAFSMTPAFEAMTSSITNTTTTNTTNLGGVSVNVYPTAGTNIDALTDLIMIKMQRAVNKRKAVFSNELHIQ